MGKPWESLDSNLNFTPYTRVTQVRGWSDGTASVWLGDLRVGSISGGCNEMKLMNLVRKSKPVKIMLAAIGMALLVSGMTAEVWAHRDRGPNDTCRREIGASLLHITLYQTQFDPVTEYCEEVPRMGKALLVVDVTPGELRQVPFGLEVIATNTSGQSQTVLSVPPKVYERGVLNTELVFQKEITYIAQVMLELEKGKDPQLLAFPIQVAAWYKAMMMPALIVAGLLVFILISVIRYNIVSRQQGEALA